MSMINVDEIAGFKVADLKRELKARGETTTGNKQDLVDRLVKAVQNATETIDEDAVLAGDDDDDINDTSLTLKEDQLLADIPPKPIETAQIAVVKPRQAVNRNSTSVAPVIPATTAEQTDSAESPSAILTKASLSTAEKLALRAKRFEDTNPSVAAAIASAGSKKPILQLSLEERKKARAARFEATLTDISTSGNKLKGATAAATGKPAASTDPEALAKLKARAERFGAVTAPEVAKAETEKNLLKRKERFGITVNSALTSSDIEAKKRVRAERFGLA